MLMESQLWVILGVIVTAVSSIAAVLTIALNQGRMKKQDLEKHENRHQMTEQKVALIEIELSAFKILIASQLESINKSLDEVKETLKGKL